MTTVLSSLASLSRKSRETESILLYTYRLQRVSHVKDPGKKTYHLIYFRWSFMITSMKSSTVANYRQGDIFLRRAKCFTVLVSDKDLAIEHLVVSQYIVQHLLVEVLGRSLEGNLHTASLLWF